MVLLAGLLVVVGMQPSPIDAVAWNPPPRPALTGPLAANTTLQQAELLAPGQIHGPEDIVFDGYGRLYTGSADGRIYRLTFGTTSEPVLEVFAETGGRPLGLRFDRAGNLIVAAKERGLLSIDPTGTVTTLTTSVDGTPITYANGLDIADDGTIYFSDSSTKFAFGFPFDMLEGRPHGRLLAYDPQTRQTTVMLSDLFFANGVVLSANQDYVLVVESFRYRITRYWLKGPRAGTHDVFAENLVGIADNLARAADGTYWVTMNNLRPALIERMHPLPIVKEQVAKLGEERLRNVVARSRYGLVVQLDAQGRVIRSLHDPTGRVYNLSAAVPYEGALYLGTLFGDSIGRFSLTAAP
mgnify:CR=1 FL=1